MIISMITIFIFQKEIVIVIKIRICDYESSQKNQNNINIYARITPQEFKELRIYKSPHMILLA